METSTERTHQPPSRVLLGVAAAVFAVLALVGVFALEFFAFGPRASGPGQASWLFWAAAIPAYFLLQFFAETVLGGFWESHSFAAKSVPIILIVLFYVAYFMYVA